MEYLYEGIVLGYLTQNSRFVCPQYTVKGDSGNGEWRSIDFVALDFDMQQVILAEVTTKADMLEFARKSKELYDQGRQRVRKQLAQSMKTVPNILDWEIVIQLFIRDDRKDDLEARIRQLQFQAEVITLEHTFQRWKPEYVK